MATKTYDLTIQQARVVLGRKGWSRPQLAEAAGVPTWVAYQYLSGKNVTIEAANKLRAALALPLVEALPPKPRAATAKAVPPAEIPPPAVADEPLPACDWQEVAAVAAELSEAAADFGCMAAAFRQAELRLRAARRRALAAGIVVAPALTISAGKPLQASEKTSRFFRMLHGAGAIT